jgi:hypothetical protein
MNSKTLAKNSCYCLTIHIIGNDFYYRSSQLSSRIRSQVIWLFHMGLQFSPDKQVSCDDKEETQDKDHIVLFRHTISHCYYARNAHTRKKRFFLFPFHTAKKVWVISSFDIRICFETRDPPEVWEVQAKRGQVRNSIFGFGLNMTFRSGIKYMLTIIS